MEKEIGFGIVGAGMISHYHAKAIAAVPGARVAAVMSTGKERREAFAREYGVPGYENMEALLADPGVDAVCIATPSGAHLEPAVAAAKAGKHVCCEKPLEITPERAQGIIDACRENKVVLAPIFQYRYSKGAKLIRRALDSGRFGKLLMSNARIKWFRPQSYYDSGVWRGSWKMDGGGCLMNQSIHAIDLFVNFTGLPTEVFGYADTANHERIEVEDNAVACVRFANGALGVIESSTACEPGWPLEVEISGTRGTAAMKSETLCRWDFIDKDPLDAEAGELLKTPAGNSGASDPKSISVDGHIAVIADMVRTIRTGENRVIDGAEAKLPIQVICGVYEAVRTGKPTRL